MTRTVNGNTYSGYNRTASVTEVTTKSEDLSVLGNLWYNLSSIEGRIEYLIEQGQTDTPEFQNLLADREAKKAEITAMQGYLAGYDTPNAQEGE